MDNEDNGIGFTSSTPATTSEGTLSFGSESPGVPEDAVTNRAAKYSFALGNDSPGQEEVAHQLASGQEDLVRKHQMAVNQLQFEQQKSQMITNLIHNSPEGIDADSADFVRGLQESDYKENPNNVMETTYARKFISSIAQRDDQRNLAAAEALHPEYAHQVLDVGEQAVARNEIVHRELENIRDEKKQQGILGAASDWAMANLMPLASVRLRNLVKESPATSQLPGSNIQEQIGYLRSLDSDQFETQFTSALKSIPNLDLREQFATAVLQQSDSDAAMTNINALGDIATVAQIGAAPLKGLVKGIVGSETHAGLAGVVRSAVTASKATDVSAARIAATTGDFREASVLNMLRETTPGIPPLPGEEEIRNKAFSINGAGQRWFTGDGPNLAGPNVRDFLDMAKKNDQLAGNFLLESPSVDRTTPEVRAAVGRELYEREIAGRDGSLSNAVLDIDSSGNLSPGSGEKYQTTFNPLTNTESISIRIGRKNGEQFPNKASAVKFAKDNFGLLKFNNDQFVSTGGKWHIRLDLDVPDHIDNLREIEIPANDRMSESFLDGMIGGILGKTRNQSNILGDSINRARMVVVHGNQKLFKVFKDMAQPIVNLNSKERTRLGQILEANRDFVDRSEPGEANRGKFFSSRQEFEEAYHGKFGILPNQKEIKAYYSYVQLNQLDGMVRNAGWARDRIRLGIHKWNDRFWETKKSTNPESLDGTKRVPHDVEFHGKQVFSIPEDEHETAIAIRNSSTGDIQIVKNKRFIGDKQRALLKKELDGKAVIIQAEDGHLTVPTPDGDVTVSHYVTATSKRSRVGINGPWKDGGHVINEHEWYVKQPIYKGNYYAGDLAVATARDEATAKQRALAFKTARDMMLRGDPNLDRYVSQNVGNGWDGKAFAQQFGGQKTADGVVRQGLDVGGDFLHTRTGERTIDRHKTGLKHGENPYNILQMDRTFSGERDATNIPALMDEKGVRHIFEDGRVLDPWAALSKAAQSMTNVKLKRDYVLKSAQLWTHQFRDILEGSNDKLRNDAVTQLYQPSYLRSIDKVLLNNAENARRSIVRFAGSSNKEEQAFDTLHSKLSELANAHLGPKANSVVSSKLLPFVKNPAQAAKSLAYTLHLGLLSPTQIFMQAQSLVNVLSISPRAGLKGVAAYYPLRAAMISPELFEHSVGSAAKLGWNADHYREMAEGMFRSGWHFVHGDQAILDTIESPKIFAGKVNKMIDWGNTFVTEGVRAHRLPAYATAYQEWRWANPTGKFDRAVEHTILKRADDLSANMSAANNATWQRGLASVPMQFATFPIRLMEGYFGKSLTLAEKGRLFAGYSMFYGIPTTVGGVVGVYPAYECVKNYLLENNIPHDDAVTQAVINGLPQLALRTLTGVNVDVGKRFGQGGIDVVQEGLALAGFDPGHLILNGDKNLFDLATGAAGSTLQDLVSTSVPFVKALWSSTVDDPKDNIYPLDTTTIERAVRNVTSANSVVKLWYALNTGRWMSKYDMVQDEVTPLEGVMMGLTGANLERIDDIFAEKGVLAGRKNLADKAALEVQDYLRRGFGFEDDDKQRQQYITIAKAHAVAGGLTEEEWRECLRAALRATVETQKDAMARRLQRDSFRRGIQ